MTIAPALSPAMSCLEARSLIAQSFAAAGFDSAATDARLILCAALDIDHASLVGDPGRPIGAAAGSIAALVHRRARGEPVSRILGRREFWSLEFAIGPAVLDPRADTETLVEAVLTAFANRTHAASRLLDLGVGSGAILAALLSQLPNADGIGIDVSEAACRVARRNLAALGLAQRASILCADWASAIDGAFDAIVTNPPYIPRGDISALASEVRDNDPHLALDGGDDGLASYRIIASAVAPLLAPGGLIALECGAGQSSRVAHLLPQADFAELTIHRDLAGHDRVITARRVV